MNKHTFIVVHFAGGQCVSPNDFKRAQRDGRVDGTCIRFGIVEKRDQHLSSCWLRNDYPAWLHHEYPEQFLFRRFTVPNEFLTEISSNALNPAFCEKLVELAT
jgi:hypothetical protein